MFAFRASVLVFFSALSCGFWFAGRMLGLFGSSAPVSEFCRGIAHPFGRLGSLGFQSVSEGRLRPDDRKSRRKWSEDCSLFL